MMHTSEMLVEIARDAIIAAEFCFLATVGADGRPSLRLMQPFPPEEDLTIWFGTSPVSRKAADIRHNPQVAVGYHDAAGIAYVTLNGRARLVEDLAERQRRWRPDWQAFWRKGPEADNYILVEFTPQHIEMMSFSQGIAPDPYGLAAQVLARDEDGWHIVS